MMLLRIVHILVATLPVDFMRCVYRNLRLARRTKTSGSFRPGDARGTRMHPLLLSSVFLGLRLKSAFGGSRNVQPFLGGDFVVATKWAVSNGSDMIMLGA